MIKFHPTYKWPIILCFIFLGILFDRINLVPNSDFVEKDNQEVLQFTGFVGRESQFFLPPHTEGEMILRFSSTTLFKEGDAYLSFFASSQVKNAVNISFDGQKWKLISQNLLYDNNKLPLTGYINGERKLYFKLWAKNDASIDQQVLNYFEFTLISRTKRFLVLNTLYLSLCFPALFFLLRFSSLALWQAAIFSGSSFVAATLVVYLTPAALDFSPALLIVILGLSILIAHQRDKDLPLSFYGLVIASLILYFASNKILAFEKHLIFLVLLLIITSKTLSYLEIKDKYKFLLALVIFFGILSRVIALLVTVHSGGDIDPDASTYHELVEEFELSNFYKASFREPFPLLILKAHYYLLNLAGAYDLWQASNFIPLRTFSLIFSVITIIATYLIARDIFDTRIGIISAAMVSSSYFLIQNSQRGLMTEFYTFFMLVFFYLLFVKRENIFFLGIVGAILLLTRTSTQLIMALALLYAIIIERGLRTPKIILPIFIAVLISLPFYLNNKKKFGELNFVTNYHTTWWKNYEFHDQIGHPTLATLQTDGYAGGRVSPAKYYFHYHTLSEVIKRITLGYHKAFSKWVLRYDPLIMPLAIIGMVLLLFSRYHYVVVMWALMILPYAFILPLRGGSERFVYESYPFFAVAVAYSWNIVHSALRSVILSNKRH